MKKLKSTYDVIVIGSGPAGHACAIRCAELGLHTLCVSFSNTNRLLSARSTNFENLSIIALLESAKLYESIVYSTINHGISVENISINLNQMMDRKKLILDDINNYLTNALIEHKIDYIYSTAQLTHANTVQLTSAHNGAKKNINGKYIVLATDSLPINLPYATIDNQYILDTTSSLNLTEIPKRIAILGAGIIGLEIAGIWSRLGSKITILEAQDGFLNVADFQISRLTYQIFSERGIEIRLGARVISTKIINRKVIVEYRDSDGIHAIKVDKLIVAPGRRPDAERIATPEANLLIDENGYVHTDENYKTNLPSVYSIGDLTMHGPMLSHKGIAEGYFLAEHLVGLNPNPVNYNSIPNVIYTDPEIAWVGKNEQTLKSMGEPIKTSTYSLNDNFRAKAFSKTSGILKLITHADSHEILGIHAIGAFASETIAEASFAIEFSANSDDFTRAIHSHPSFSEAFYEIKI